MKRHFGEYRSLLKACAKHHGRRAEDFGTVWQPDVSDLSVDAQGVYLARMTAELLLLRGELTHYFIATPELADHLTAIGRCHEPRMLEILQDEGLAAGVIHTSGPAADAALFSWCPSRPTELLVSDNRAHEMWLAGHKTESRSINLVFGLALYLNCFPHAARDGFPEFAKHPAHYRKQACRAIQAVPELIERGGPTPHFRRGHFRILRSEKFTHKRWQVVFVGETFVKGKAKTVCELQPIPA